MNPYVVVFTLALLSSTSSLNAMDRGDDIERGIQQARQEKLQSVHKRDSATNHFKYLEKVNENSDVHKRDAHNVAENVALMGKTHATIQQAKTERDQEFARRAEKRFEIEVLLKLKLQDIDDISKIMEEKDITTRERNKELYYKSRNNKKQKHTVQQTKLREKLPQFIDALRKELKLSHADMDEYLSKCGEMSYKALDAELTKVISGSSVLKEQQAKHSKNDFSATEIEIPTIKYDNKNCVCLTHGKFHKKITKQLTDYFDPTQTLDALELYKILQIHEDSIAYKGLRNRARIDATYDELKTFMEKSSGFIIIPSPESNPHDHALLKVQFGINRETRYLYYAGQLPKKFGLEHPYLTYKQNYTFVCLKSGAVFAVQDNVPNGLLLSLSTRAPLSTPELQELNTIANQIWTQQHSPLAPAEEILPSIEIAPTVEIEEIPTPIIHVVAFEEESKEFPTPMIDLELPGKITLKSTGQPQDVKEDSGKITVVTDYNANASYQLESNRFTVEEDGILKVPYHITVQPGGRISLGLLNTGRNGWYGDELILGEGTYQGIYKRRVPAGETEASVVFRNYHLETPGQTTFTIEEPIEIQQEASLRLHATGLPAYFTKEAEGKITVVTDHNNYASYQLMSERFLVQENNIIKIPYKITVQPGGRMSLGVLNTGRNGWYGDELILEEGTHENVYLRRVPAGESEASLVFRNYHLETPGQTTFTIEEIDIQLETVDIIPQTVPVEPTTVVDCELPIKLPLKSMDVSQEIRNENGKITVVTDHNNYASYQLTSDRFPVAAGGLIKVPYSITVEPGGRMSLGVLNTGRNGWYGDELILESGTHENVYERTVPAGETEASLVFRNYHLAEPGQTTFTIHKLDIQQAAESEPVEIAGQPVMEKGVDVDLNPTAAPQSVERDELGRMTVLTDNNANASYQLESHRFVVEEGGFIKVPYNITVQPGGRMSLGVLNTGRNGWYGDELILESGTYESVYERIVPAGETEASLVFRNYHLETPGQSTFTINKLGLQKGRG